MDISPAADGSGGSRPALSDKKALREAATQLEATFLAEMLKGTGMGQTRGAFGGGAGEDQFGSLLLREQAVQLARAGGIGLSEVLFNALLEAQNDRSDTQ